MTKQKIVPHLWFDKEAVEAANFYSSAFPNLSITSTSTLHDTPSGDCDVVSFTVFGHPFMAISAGPLFKFNPSISFVVNFDPSQNADAKTRIEKEGAVNFTNFQLEGQWFAAMDSARPHEFASMKLFRS